jgi:hypothetical protein
LDVGALPPLPPFPPLPPLPVWRGAHNRGERNFQPGKELSKRKESTSLGCPPPILRRKHAHTIIIIIMMMITTALLKLDARRRGPLDHETRPSPASVTFPRPVNQSPVGIRHGGGLPGADSPLRLPHDSPALNRTHHGREDRYKGPRISVAFRICAALCQLIAGSKAGADETEGRAPVPTERGAHVGGAGRAPRENFPAPSPSRDVTVTPPPDVRPDRRGANPIAPTRLLPATRDFSVALLRAFSKTAGLCYKGLYYRLCVRTGSSSLFCLFFVL